jgi:hypothetical protein
LRKSFQNVRREKTVAISVTSENATEPGGSPAHDPIKKAERAGANPEARDERGYDTNPNC